MVDENTGADLNAQDNTNAVDGATGQSWLDNLGEDLKGNEALQGFESLDDLGKKYLELVEATAGQEKPETANDYEVPIPEGLQADEAFLGKFKEKALELGLSKAQVKGLAEFYNGSVQEQIQAMETFQAEAAEKRKNDAVNTLKDEWKDKYDQNLDVSKKAFRAVADPEIIDVMDKSGWGDHPMMIRLFHKIGTMISEDKLARDETNKGETVNRDASGRRMLSFSSMQGST